VRSRERSTENAERGGRERKGDFWNKKERIL
jgi:hypothetical protein